MHKISTTICTETRNYHDFTIKLPVRLAVLLCLWCISLPTHSSTASSSFFYCFLSFQTRKNLLPKTISFIFRFVGSFEDKKGTPGEEIYEIFSGAHTNTVVWTGTSPATKACIVCEIKYKNYLLLETDIIKGSVFVRPRPSTATFLVSQLLSSQHIKLFLALLLISRLPPLCVHCSHCCLYGFQWVLFNIFNFIYGCCSRCFLLLFSVCSSLLAQHFTSHTFHIFFARLFYVCCFSLQWRIIPPSFRFFIFARARVGV